MKKVHGHIEGLKANQKKRLESIYRRRLPQGYAVTAELAHELAAISHEIRRQVACLANRSGKVEFVIVGTPDQIYIPELKGYSPLPGRLLGLRYVHTHLKPEEGLTRDDHTDLALLRFDLMAAITLTLNGSVHRVHTAHVTSDATGSPTQELPPMAPGHLRDDLDAIVQGVEDELARKERVLSAGDAEERAILVSVTTRPRKEAMASLKELEELAESCNIDIMETVLQIRKKSDAKHLLGSGKLNEITIAAMQKGASILIFDQELSPAQIRSITDQVEIKVIDRTQMILDIFARRAQTREGKLQVELAQLKYMLPRLITLNTAMSRLTGGIGGRGPGETKLELNRRRVRDRITALTKLIDNVKKQRGQQRARRNRKGVPVVSIVGYTNAGKSTLLNTLTQSQVLAEDRLFATLDPSSRRLRFPKDIEVIITDTVGFIRDLPKELMVSFRATLEELESADLLLHIIDAANPQCEKQIDSVEKILSDLKLDAIPVLKVFNKTDCIDDDRRETLSREHGGLFISALNRATMAPLLHSIEDQIETLITDNLPGDEPVDETDSQE
ncbi:GTPase HflX [Desulfoluna limicola]|uniref:GTPase HflX n=1 Tax=Desulfoluna limicola TaxID=2810562 RepID=A0ABN6EYT5_9BACT|nr:GTPase HflX [Desulfoluna limicola]BCS94375.1 GTPase HflX [Desulfoluna limicola]